jgi:hypothetical protein
LWLSTDAIIGATSRDALDHLPEHDLPQVRLRRLTTRLVEFASVEVGEADFDTTAILADAEAVSIDDVGHFAGERIALLR